jgi:hypothetical protein
VPAARDVVDDDLIVWNVERRRIDFVALQYRVTNGRRLAAEARTNPANRSVSWPCPDPATGFPVLPRCRPIGRRCGCCSRAPSSCPESARPDRAPRCRRRGWRCRCRRHAGERQPRLTWPLAP